MKTSAKYFGLFSIFGEVTSIPEKLGLFTNVSLAVIRL